MCKDVFHFQLFSKMNLTTQLVFAVLCVSSARAFGNSTRRSLVKCPYKVRSQLLDRWIMQKLDHFDDAETRTWPMRYLAKDRYFKNGGPIFIFLGGEEEIEEDPLLCGHFRDMAKQNNGYLFHTEHRYYGNSRPTANLDTPSLKYLSAKQALEDVAHFILTIKADIPGLANSKVIMAGGSYAGSLVVWFKHLYPHLVNGGWASSAPISVKFGIPEGTKVVGYDIHALGSDECYNRVRNGIAEIEYMLANGQSAQVKALFKISNDFDATNDLDLQSLSYSIFLQFGAYALLEAQNYFPFVCKLVMQGNYAHEGLAKFILHEYPDGFKASFRDNFDDLLDNADTSGLRRWYYLLCSELGWFMTSESLNQPFGQKFPLSFFINVCGYLFGKEYTKVYIERKLEEANHLFGGMNPNVDNIYMTHGEFDPWRPIGLQAGITIIPGVLHCSDFNTISSNDSPAMMRSKEKLARWVQIWLTE